MDHLNYIYKLYCYVEWMGLLYEYLLKQRGEISLLEGPFDA